MSDLNQSTSNLTQTGLDQNQTLKMSLCVTPCILLLYVSGVMIFTLRKKTVFMETPRYILFGHMLWVDTLLLFMSVMLFVIAVCKIIFLKNICLLFLVTASTLSHVSTLNLSLMSLERYVAICFPLRHAEITTSKRTNMAIGFVWILGLVQPLSDMIVYYGIDTTNTNLVNLYCSKTTSFRLPVYKKINISITSAYFVLVCLVIIFTYASIATVAKTAACDKASAKKASNTVLLHLFQLFLCILSLLTEPINEFMYVYVDYKTSLNLMYFFFIVLIVVPKCLSPFIYGLRDQAFSALFKYYFTFGLKSQNRCIRCKTRTHIRTSACSKKEVFFSQRTRVISPGHNRQTLRDHKNADKK